MALTFYLPAACNHGNTWRVVNRVAVGQGDECWRHIRAVPDGTIIIMFLQTVNKWQLHVHPGRPNQGYQLTRHPSVDVLHTVAQDALTASLGYAEFHITQRHNIRMRDDLAVHADGPAFGVQV